MAPYVTYVLQSETSGMLYTGYTANLPQRLSQHNDPQSRSYKFTRKYAPWHLVYSEEHPTRSEAMAREKFLKSGQGREWLKTKLLAVRG